MDSISPLCYFRAMCPALEGQFDTIAALATAPGEGSIAVVRVSGPKAIDVADLIFGSAHGTPPSRSPPSSIIHGRIIDAAGHVIDDVVLLVFRAPHSYTGEDVIEIQCHGGTTVPKRILRRALEAGVRMAAPGEFTRRAFLHGKMDLVQAEAVADLIRAQTDRAATHALNQLSGRLSTAFSSIYTGLLAACTHLEVMLDFPEEEVPDRLWEGVRKNQKQALSEIQRLLETWEEGRILREGASVVIVGRPNSGKSTLFNSLVGEDRAIVSHLPGTTRDAIESFVSMGGIPIRLVDTAGLRESTCAIETEGVRRARKSAKSADLILVVVDAAAESAPPDEFATRDQDTQTLLIHNKSDLIPLPALADHPESLWISAKTGAGLDLLRKRIVEMLEKPVGGGFSHEVAISERHRRALLLAKDEAESAGRLLDSDPEQNAELAIQHLRSSADAIGEVIGRKFSEEILDNIFSSFCIGK